MDGIILPMEYYPSINTKKYKLMACRLGPWARDRVHIRISLKLRKYRKLILRSLIAIKINSSNYAYIYVEI